MRAKTEDIDPADVLYQSAFMVPADADMRGFYMEYYPLREVL